jgi:hypothetical protein
MPDKAKGKAKGKLQQARDVRRKARGGSGVQQAEAPAIAPGAGAGSKHAASGTRGDR